MNRYKEAEQTGRDPIIAYRAWRIVENRLLSCMTEHIWQPLVRMDARCNQWIFFHISDIPVRKCTCGLYAYKTDDALSASELLNPSFGLAVRGRVALWGRVIDHEAGYRAERAYPQVLYLTGEPRTDELIRNVADSYAIECVPDPSL
jgi:hypothetical protein